MNLRLTLIVRRDLKLEEVSVGLFGSQVSHLATMWLFERAKTEDNVIFSSDELAWMASPYTYIHGVQTREELDAISAIADQHPDKPLMRKWIDTIPAPTLGGSIKVPVGIAIGPCDTDIVKQIIGDLPLY